MSAIAYCAKAFAHSARVVTGAEPITCPPTSAQDFQPVFLQGDFVYIKLHGLHDQPFWYGDHWITAITADQLASLDLSRSVVFVATCYFPESPMLAALKATHPRLIIGGYERNYAVPDKLAGPDYLALTMRRLLAIHVPPTAAFYVARTKLKMHRNHDITTWDALQFDVL